MINDCTEAEARGFKNLIEYFSRLAEDGITPFIEKQLLLMLNSVINFHSHLHDEAVFPELTRLTINKKIHNSNKRIYDINHLKYPPAHLVSSYGRCNIPGQSVLYAGFDWITILSELKPLKGDLITTSKWRVKNDASLRFCPIFLKQPVDGTVNIDSLKYERIYQKELQKYPSNIRSKIAFLNNFVAESFSKKFPHSSNHLNYIFSAYFSNEILNTYLDGRIDAILYPSVRQGLSFQNIAIKPPIFDVHYELIEVQESFVVMDHTDGRGGYFTEGISDCKKFDNENGKILWDVDKVYQSRAKINEYKTYWGYEV